MLNLTIFVTYITTKIKPFFELFLSEKTDKLNLMKLYKTMEYKYFKK